MWWKTWVRSQLKCCLQNKLSIFASIVLLCACSPFSNPERPARPDVSVYQASAIDNPLIQYIWLEIPQPFEPGTAEVRLFLARSSPPEPVIPNPTGLKCILESEEAYAELGPEMVTFKFSEDGSFRGSYTYRACPECVECYMNWDYTLEFSGAIEGESATLDIGVRHIGLNVPGSYLSVEMERLAGNTHQPQMRCRADGTCTEIVTVDRDG